MSKVTGLSQSGIKSILSTLSDEKLQEIASAMSTIQPQDASAGGGGVAAGRPSGKSSFPSLDERLLALQTEKLLNPLSSNPTPPPTATSSVPVAPSSSDSSHPSRQQEISSSSSSSYYSFYDDRYSRHSYDEGSYRGGGASYPSDSGYRDYKDDYRRSDDMYWKERGTSSS